MPELFEMAPVSSNRRSAKVLFPWSTWAIVLKLRILSIGILERSCGRESDFVGVEQVRRRIWMLKGGDEN